ncbi:flagellar hook-associated protein FlgL [Paenisporosarcina indica]|uniref:flagellar hook-associated protein FlgL n=1 Tax=Paenisporosarcina indica TaxID=650093 RepID=UPI000A5563D4|nr:flagellar hook-associated protein FlgL [Paenisporosarcina indica]
MMRVTQQMLHQNSVRHMNQNLGRMEKTNNQLSSGKLHHKPSDDPYAVSKSMNLKSAIAANGQYERNVNEAKLWLDETDQTINQMVNVMQRVRELAVKGSNETLNDQDREIIATEVKELTLQIQQLSEAKVNGEYPLFDSSPKTFKIAEGIEVPANVSADALFNNGGVNLFDTLESIVSSLGSGDPIQLDKIDKGINQLLTTSAEAGARFNRVESIENRVLDTNLALKSMLSSIEDVDYAETITKLKSEESVYQASLAAAAKIIQPSLMDFLR